MQTAGLPTGLKLYFNQKNTGLIVNVKLAKQKKAFKGRNPQRRQDHFICASLRSENQCNGRRGDHTAVNPSASSHKASKSSWKACDSSRKASESSRTTSLSSRKPSESSPTTSQRSRKSSQTSQTSSESSGKSFETSQTSSESSRNASENSRTTSESSRKLSENSRKPSKSSWKPSENSRTARRPCDASASGRTDFQNVSPKQKKWPDASAF
jgi:hypothetical protein